MKSFHAVLKKRAFMQRQSKKMAAVFLALMISFTAVPIASDACTGLYVGSSTTANGSVYVCRSEDYGPDYAKQFVIVPAADHEVGELFRDDYGFCAPYPAHTLRYSAIMDDPSCYDGIAAVPFGEAGINEMGVSVSATVSTYFNNSVLAADPLTTGGLTEMSMASWILQSAETASDGVRILAECIDTYGHGNPDPKNPDCAETSTIYIADRQEAWIFEIVSGHQYVATKLSDDTVSLSPNAIMTQQVNTTDQNIVASPGLITTARDGGFYTSDIAGDNEINVAKSYSEGYASYASFRYYYAAWLLNRNLAETTDVVPQPAANTAGVYPFASVDETAVGPFLLEYLPSEEICGTIDIMLLRNILASHGEGTPYETTSMNTSADGIYRRSIGTYRQNEEHIFEIRRNNSLPDSVCIVEWLALGPSEFSVYIPFYTAAMTETPDSYRTDSPESFSPDAVYWFFNEIGKAGNGLYYRADENDVYHDRYGNEISTSTAEAVLEHLSATDFINRLHDDMRHLQEEVNTRFASDDEKMIVLAGNASDEAVSALAYQLAKENAEYIKQAASEILSGIDNKVSAYIESLD